MNFIKLAAGHIGEAAIIAGPGFAKCTLGHYWQPVSAVAAVS
jgi:hypothetical protein